MIRREGLLPVYVDILPNHFCIDTSRIEEAITEKTVAVLPVHLYGRACDMDSIMAIAKKYKLAVIEDCAQACGCYWKGRMVGSIGDAAFFSFGPTKNLAMLWAGMITTNDSDIAEKVRKETGYLPRMDKIELIKRLINALAMRFVANPVFWSVFMAPLLKRFSQKGKDPIEAITRETPGKMNKTDEKAQMMPGPIQDVIGRKQLEKLDISNSKRVRNGNYLIKKLEGVPGLGVPEVSGKNENIFMTFPIIHKNRQLIRKKLLLKGVDTAIGYMTVCPGMENTVNINELAPNAINAVEKMLHIPVYPDLDIRDLNLMVMGIKEAMGN